LGSKDVFVASLATGFGSVATSGTIGSSAEDTAGDVSLDASGNPVVAVSFQGTATLTPSTLVSLGARDVGVAVLSGQDTFSLYSRAGGTGDDYVNALAISDDGVYVGGSIQSSASLGSSSYTSVGGRDWFLAKITSALVW
jgi:hypothetical protein